MPMTDHYGNALTTQSAPARDHYVAGVDLFLAATFGAVDAFAQAVAADPGFALGHVGLARARMMGGDMPGAKAAIASAVALQDDCTPRERQHIAAFALLLQGSVAESRAMVLRHSQEYPRDAMVVQLCTSVFGLIGFSGETGREAQLLAYTSRLMPHYGEDWWMMSMHAISLCETGQSAASEALMDRSLALNPSNANASHFKAHAQYESGQTATGLAFLTDWLQGYDPRGLMHGHLSWHAALWSLHAGDVDGMWRAVDGAIAPGASQGPALNILTDTAAIYYRAELAGVDVPAARWSDLSDYAARMFPASGQSFADMHAALSHAMAGNGDRLGQLADSAAGFAGDLVRPIARAWGAMARADWSTAVDTLAPVLASHERLGGSRAQRDLLELAYLSALMKLGRGEEAHRMLVSRRPVFDGVLPLAA